VVSKVPSWFGIRRLIFCAGVAATASGISPQCWRIPVRLPTRARLPTTPAQPRRALLAEQIELREPRIAGSGIVAQSTIYATALAAVRRLLQLLSAPLHPQVSRFSDVPSGSSDASRGARYGCESRHDRRVHFSVPHRSWCDVSIRRVFTCLGSSLRDTVEHPSAGFLFWLGAGFRRFVSGELPNPCKRPPRLDSARRDKRTILQQSSFAIAIQ
jgi:hypothetical protein